LQDQVIGGNKAGKLATLYSPAKVQSGADQQLTLITKRYATDASRIIVPPISINQMYQKADADSYTAGIDGETVIPLPQWIGWDVLSVEDEVKPLKKSEYAWNKSSGTLALQGGLTLRKPDAVFPLYQNDYPVMKKLALIVSLLFSLSSLHAQGPGTLYGAYKFMGTLGIPKDTLLPPTANRLQPHVAGLGDSLYLWSWRQGKWIIVIGSGGGEPRTQTDTDSRWPPPSLR
jgi:hypothetical protein